jgi:hypothetical protein
MQHRKCEQQMPVVETSYPSSTVQRVLQETHHVQEGIV